MAEYSAQLGDSPEVREALTTVLAYAAEIDPEQDAADDDELPSDVAEAYRVLAAAVGTEDSEEPLLGAGWDPDEAFGEAVQEQEDDGLLGDGWFQKLREAVLTPLRQLTFWHGKNQAREFGERGAAELAARRHGGQSRARAPHGAQLRHDRGVQRRPRTRQVRPLPRRGR